MSWTAPPMLNAIKEKFDNWGDLADVEVFTAPVVKLNKSENIVFTKIPGSQEWAALGNQSREENYTLEGVIHVVRSGATEAKATEARDKVHEIVLAMGAALQDLNLSELAPVIGARQILDVSLVTADLDQGGTAAKNRWAHVDFDIRVKTRTGGT